MKIWVVLPAYNEEMGVPLLLDSLVEVFEDDRRDYRIIIVNDGSSDATGKIIDQYSTKNQQVIAVHNEKNSGLAETLKRGLLEAVGRASPQDIIVTMDADNTHPAGLALRMVRSIREGSDVVIASRYRPDSRVMGLSFFRVLLSYGASILFRSILPMKGVKDYTCGYRAYKAVVIQELVRKHAETFISERGFSCMVDILLKLRNSDLVFTEVPLILRYDLKQGVSKMKVLQTTTDTLRLMFRRRFGM